MDWLKSFRKTPDPSMPREEDYPSQDLPNFTPRAQQVLALARREADRLHHNFVGTEHLLLGLIQHGQGTAVSALRNMGIDLESARREVERQVGPGSEQTAPEPTTIVHPPYTPRVKKVLTFATKEAQALRHTYVGTEHLLLGLLREADNVAARVLVNLGANLEQTRQNVLRELEPNSSGSSRDRTTPSKPHWFHPDPLDLTRRYDVWCREGNEQVLHPNVLFKGIKTLFQKKEYDVFSEYIELEAPNGQTIFVARATITKFSEHRAPPD